MIDLQFDERIGERYRSKFKLMQIAAKMTDWGWRVSRERLRAHNEAARVRWGGFDERLRALGLDGDYLGKSGMGQTLAMRQWFKERGAPDVCFDKRTKKPQFNTAALIEWAQHKDSDYADAAAALYAVRKNARLLNYIDTYLKFSEADGRIHFGFNPLGTQTGRWSASTKMRLIEDSGRRTISANAQQIPKKRIAYTFAGDAEPTLLTESLRDCFIADEGCVLLRADYDQQELRLIAYTYGVKRMLDALNDPTKDAHMVTAEALFSELLRGATDETRKKCRTAAKPCTYAISYQMSNASKLGKYATLHKTLRETFPTITEQHVQMLVQRFFTAYPEIREGQQAARKEVDKTGRGQLTIDGRQLYYPATNRGYNQRLNFTMQGTGAAMCDRALVELDPRLDWATGEQVRGQIHDELVAHAPFASADRVAREMEECMSLPAQIGETFAGVPASADPGFDWNDCVSRARFDEMHPGVLTPA